MNLQTVLTSTNKTNNAKLDNTRIIALFTPIFDLVTFRQSFQYIYLIISRVVVRAIVMNDYLHVMNRSFYIIFSSGILYLYQMLSYFL